MSVLDAAYRTGRDYPGGIEALAQRIGHPNLSDELNSNRRNAKLGLETAVDMQLFSNDYRILYEMAAALRHYPPVPLPEALPGDAPCLFTLSRLAEEFAKVVAEVAKDLTDGKVTNSELAAVRHKWGELVSTGQHLVGQLTDMNAALRALAPEEAE